MVGQEISFSDCHRAVGRQCGNGGDDAAVGTVCGEAGDGAVQLSDADMDSGLHGRTRCRRIRERICRGTEDAVWGNCCRFAVGNVAVAAAKSGCGRAAARWHPAADWGGWRWDGIRKKNEI